jgi:hypothetical protein
MCDVVARSGPIRGGGARVRSGRGPDLGGSELMKYSGAPERTFQMVPN